MKAAALLVLAIIAGFVFVSELLLIGFRLQPDTGITKTKAIEIATKEIGVRENPQPPSSWLECSRYGDDGWIVTRSDWVGNIIDTNGLCINYYRKIRVVIDKRGKITDYTSKSNFPKNP